MLDEKHLNEIKYRIDGLVKKGDISIKNSSDYVNFFLRNSKDSFDVRNF